jgi:hypothetical protein
MNPRKPIHGQAIPFHVAHGYADAPPVPCDFKLGDRVIFTNDAGLRFERAVRAFSKETTDFLPLNFIYIFEDNSSWWSPVRADQLKHAEATP